MNIALYPQTADQLASQCPYCGSERLTNNYVGKPIERKCSIEVTCGGCGHLHYINYTATSITLVTTDDPPRLIDFFLPVEDSGTCGRSRNWKIRVSTIRKMPKPYRSASALDRTV